MQVRVVVRTIRNPTHLASEETSNTAFYNKIFKMNKKNHRLVGTLSSKDGMQNLIADLENAKSTSSARIVSSVTLSQPLIHSTPYTKKPLTETNKGIKYTNANTKKLLTETNKGIKYTNNNTKKPLTEMNKRIKYTDDTHVISNSETSLLTTVSKKQLPQNSVTLTPQCEQSEQAITNRSTFQLKEYKSKNQCLNQMSVPKNTTSQIKPSETSNKSIIAKSSDCSLNTSKSNVTEHKHIINVFQELFQKVNERLDVIEKTESENHAMLLRLTKITNRRVQSMPKCFPFKSVENLMQFDDASDEIYNEVVDYFIYLGGLNPIDCAAIYFKCAFENAEKTSLEVTWHGTKDLKALKTTRFAHACEDAISSNSNFPKPRRNEFDDAMIKALKSTKERFRRQQKRPRCLENDELEEPLIRRARISNRRQKDGQSVNSDDARQDVHDDQDCTNMSDITEQLDISEQSPDYNPAVYNDDYDD